MRASRYFLAGLAIAGILVISVLIHQQRRNSASSIAVANSSGSSAHAGEPASPTAAPKPLNSTGTTKDSARKAFRARIFEEYRCQKESCAPNPFMAENEREALWMRMRGYPSKQQQEDAKRLSTGELKAKADSGDLVAASLYGQRLIEENDWNGAHATILKTIQSGNIYALYTLAYWEGNHPKHPNPLEARAMIRLAYLAGDYKSTEVLVETFPRFNSPVEQAFIDRNAAHYYRNMLRYRTYPRPSSSE
jgi:hypothetical protein